MRGELASMKGRTSHYAEKGSECTPGEMERAMKDKKRAEMMLKRGLGEQDAMLAREVIQNVRELEGSSIGADHEFGSPTGWL